MATGVIEDATVRVEQGLLRGRGDGTVVAWRGVPYAAAPTGARRFLPPAAAESWTGTRDAVADGPVPPQNRSRLAHVMGDVDPPQGEDCLTLTVHAPAGAGTRRPVVVWLHGGAWLSGAGSLAWYGGRSFAANGVVAVGVNYRLGALGFLRLPGVSDGNLGLLDQVAALAWVRDNIGAFGGDPGNVTVMGQSAGGHSIAVLMTMPAARGLFRRAIIQSAPMGLPARFADVTPPFLPVADGSNIPGGVMEALAAGAAAGIDIIIGTTREEMAAFYAIDKAVQDADEDAVARQFASVLGAAGPAHRRAYEAMRASRKPVDLIGDLMTDLRFRVHSLGFAERQAALGRPAYVYQFDWQSPQFASCHCLEIPFMFDNLADWPGSPMLAGADAGEMAALAKAMHGAWVAFARSGDPNHAGLPPWRPYEPTRRTTMRFDRISGPVDDLAGVSWRPAWPT
jgi:para-nitrobenzyl esterase